MIGNIVAFQGNKNKHMQIFSSVTDSKFSSDSLTSDLTSDEEEEIKQIQQKKKSTMRRRNAVQAASGAKVKGLRRQLNNKSPPTKNLKSASNLKLGEPKHSSDLDDHNMRFTGSSVQISQRGLLKGLQHTDRNEFYENQMDQIVNEVETNGQRKSQVTNKTQFNASQLSTLQRKRVQLHIPTLESSASDDHTPDLQTAMQMQRQSLQKYQTKKYSEDLKQQSDEKLNSKNQKDKQKEYDQEEEEEELMMPDEEDQQDRKNTNENKDTDKSKDKRQSQSKKSHKIEFTKEYIDYLNQVYRDGRSAENIAKEEALQLAQQEQPPLCTRLKYGIKCKKPPRPGDEEDEDWSVILTPSFSSGDSDYEQKMEFEGLSNPDKYQRIKVLWHKLMAKAIGGARIIRRFNGLADDIMMLGASKKIDLDIDEEITPLPFILMPENKFRMAWNVVTVLLLLYTAFFVPYRTAFIDDLPESFTNFEWSVDALFMFDIILNFISAYEDSDKNIEVRMKMIASSYVRSWFFFDLAAVIPFQLLADSSTLSGDSTTTTTTTTTSSGTKKGKSSNINKLIRLARLPRLYRLLRILRLFKIFTLLKRNATFKKLQDIMNVNIGIKRMIMVALSLLFMVHLMACIWYLVAKFQDFDDNCWVTLAGIYDDEDIYQYLASVYWTLMTLTTVGYGDIHAVSMAEKLTSIIWMMIGVGFYSFTIGNLASIFNSIDVKAANLQQKLDILSKLSKRTKLPEDVQNRIIRFLENNHNEHLTLFDQKQLFSEIPSSLRTEVVSHTHSEIIKKIKFFSDKEPHFLYTILPILKPMKVYQKDILYNQGDYAEEVFFILKGRVKMYFNVNEGANDGKIINIPFNLYVEGSYFGDSDLFVTENRNVRDCTAIAVIECQLLVITRKELFDIIRRFKKIFVEMREVSFERKKHHERQIKQVIEKYKKNPTSDNHILSSHGISSQKNKDLEQKKNILTNKLRNKGYKKENAKEALVEMLEKVNQAEKNMDSSSYQNSKLNKTDGESTNRHIGIEIPALDKRSTIEVINFVMPPNNNQVMPLQSNNEPLFQFRSDSLESQTLTQQTTSNQLMVPKQVEQVQVPLIQMEPFSDSNKPQQHFAQIMIGNLSNRSLAIKSQEQSQANVPKQQLQIQIDNKASVESFSMTQSIRQQQQRQNDNHNMNINEGQRISTATKEPDSNVISHRFELASGSSSSHSTSQEESGGSSISDGQSDDVPGLKDLRRHHKNDPISDDEEDTDSQWNQNEQIFASFQENMALIAGNSFEILQLYEIIMKDYQKINERIDNMELHNGQIEERNQQLEEKLERLVKLL